MGAARGGSIERREPTLDRGDLAAFARRSDESATRSDAVYQWRQDFEERRLLETRAAYVKLGLWLLAWFGMVCVCQQAAQSLQPRSPDGLMYLLAAIGSAALLLVAFWRTVWRLMWWLIGLVIVLAIIKGAFLIIFAL
ncbi:hypothetical protein [Caballeronia sp. GAFFF1]|uniref:hypothetical protein n=1 Tax=Caballeronia sp. GAFFF1 TaxID=2921779 RepID=UPI002028490D|nr:hypothetical protein [Caballeronia sp. GAFFF1]